MRLGGCWWLLCARLFSGSQVRQRLTHDVLNLLQQDAIGPLDFREAFLHELVLLVLVREGSVELSLSLDYMIAVRTLWSDSLQLPPVDPFVSLLLELVAKFVALHEVSIHCS